MFATSEPLLLDDEVLLEDEPVIALEIALELLPTLEMLLMSDLAKSPCRMRRLRRMPSSCR
ncbi:hypothetical protein GCM10010872_03310 [Dyella flava]|nr:hypothetical protein GCM10010872_03310 [Dyella flava]